MANALFPRCDIPEKDKTPAWCGKVLDYAEYLLQAYNFRRAEFTSLYRSYNGVKTPQQNAIWQRTYGKENKAKYIAYRAGRTKINLLQGEFLKRPLAATVETINKEAMSEKMRQMNFMVGAMHAKDAIRDLKEKVGVDVMEGAPVPESEDDPIWTKMSFKDKCEDIMQIILNEQIKSLNLVHIFGEQFVDLAVTNLPFGKIEIDEYGNVRFKRFDPRDAIYEEIEGDYFLEKSTVKGGRERLAIHEVLSRYDFTDKERDTLNDIRSNFSAKYSSSKMIRNNNGEILVDVIHVEWKASRPRYYKIAKKTKNQLDWDSEKDTVMFEIPAEQYEKNKAAFDKDVASGKYIIETRWEEDLWEATRIGGLIDKNCRRKPFQMRRHDSPAYILDSSYIGLNFGKIDGVSISIQKTLENFDNMFDIVMYQLLKELNKMKGKVMIYNRAALPKNKTMKDIAYDMANDSFIDVDTSGATNFSGRNLDGLDLFREVDLGLSQSVQQLLVLKDQLLMTMDRITGINETREGNIQASATVTNSQQAIENSRTQTAPMYYAFELYIEKVLTRICEATKISYAFFNKEKGEQILGASKLNFLQVTQEIGYRDYGVHIQPGGKYMDVKQKMRAMLELSLNAKEISPLDILKFEMSETFVEAEKIFQDAYIRIQENAIRQQQAEIQSRQQMQQQQLEQQVQLSREEREDIQQHDINKIAAEGEKEILVDDNKTKNKMGVDQQNAENKFLQGN